MRALVTGAGGFVGQWLCAELLRDGWDVHGATLTGAPAGGTLHKWQRDAVFWHDVDLRNHADVEMVVDAAQPEAVFHLAAVAHVPQAAADPAAAWATNVLAPLHLLEVIGTRHRAGTLDPIVIVAGSGEQYGAHLAAEMPLTESAEQRPASVYAATKVAQEAFALATWRATGVRIVATRAFNHSGPGQQPGYLLPSLVQRAVDAFETGGESVRIGNPLVVRDFLHVEDVVRAYIYLARRGTPGEAYNICSGIGTSVGDLAALVIEAAGRAARFADDRAGSRSVHAESDPALVRAVDIPALVGSPEKLTRTTSWQPKHTLEMLVDDLLYPEDYDETD